MAKINGPGWFRVLLKKYRVAAGLSQEELAERAGLSRRGVSDLERGTRRSPRPATVRRLVDALQLDESERAAFLTAAGAVLASPADVDDDGQFRPNVPLSLTTFIGRAHELAEIQRLLHTTRLLTLSGPGRIGETRLALQLVQAEASDRADDVSFVDLSPLADASLVEQTVAASLGVWEQPAVL